MKEAEIFAECRARSPNGLWFYGIGSTGEIRKSISSRCWTGGSWLDHGQGIKASSAGRCGDL